MSFIQKIYSLITVFAVLAAGAAGVCGQNRAAVSGAEATGTFRAKGGNEFKILALGKGRLRIAFSGIYEYESPAGPTANVGEIEGEAIISADRAVFEPEDFDDCRIAFLFRRGGRLEVEQTGDCGFGMNVTASGLYRKISGAKPKF